MSTFVYGHHKVKDYNAWRPFFNSDEQRRLSFGIVTKSILCKEGDANDIHFLFQVESLEKFTACFQDPALANIMEQAGVLEKPEMVILHEL